MLVDPVISLLAALCGVLLFGWTAVNKWRAPRQFAATVAEYRLVPEMAAPVVALALALLEAAVCASLLWPATRAAGAATGAALLLLYACAMAVNLARGRRNLDCGCGLVRRSISAGMVLRNVALAGLLALPWLPASTRTMATADYATVAGALIVCALLYASAELLLARPVLRTFPAAEAP